MFEGLNHERDGDPRLLAAKPAPAYPLREDERHPERTRWEYRVIEIGSETALNSLGLQGWELVCAINRDPAPDILYWKRRLP